MKKFNKNKDKKKFSLILKEVKGDIVDILIYIVVLLILMPAVTTIVLEILRIMGMF